MLPGLRDSGAWASLGKAHNSRPEHCRDNHAVHRIPHSVETGERCHANRMSNIRYISNECLLPGDVQEFPSSGFLRAMESVWHFATGVRERTRS